MVQIVQRLIIILILIQVIIILLHIQVIIIRTITITGIIIITDIIHKHIQVLIHIIIRQDITHSQHRNIILTHIIMGHGIQRILGQIIVIILIVLDTIITDVIIIMGIIQITLTEITIIMDIIPIILMEIIIIMGTTTVMDMGIRRMGVRS